MVYLTDGSTLLDGETVASFDIIICVDQDSDLTVWNPGTGLPADEAVNCFSDAGMNGYVPWIDDSNMPGAAYYATTFQVGQPGSVGDTFRVWVNGSKFGSVVSQDGYVGALGATPQGDGTYAAIDSTFTFGAGASMWFDFQIPGPGFAPDPTATVSSLAPVSPSADNTPAVTYTHANNPASVTVYAWDTAGPGPWVAVGTDGTVTGPPDTFDTNVMAAGTYLFTAIPTGGNPTDPVPTVVGDSEFGPYTILPAGDVVPPDTTIVSVLPAFVGQCPNTVTITVFGDDTGTGGSNILSAQYRIDRNDDGDFNDALPAWYGLDEAWHAVDDTATAAGPTRTFTEAIDLHNCTITAGTFNIEARAADVAGYDATPASTNFAIADSTSPVNARIAPTPTDGNIRAPGDTVIRITATDFRMTTALITVTAPTASVVNAPMTQINWAKGSNIVTFEYTITENTDGAVTWSVDTDDGPNPATTTAGFYTVQSGMLGPNAPYSIAGRVFQYNGAAGLYNPLIQDNANVIVQTVNFTGDLKTYGPQNTDAAGNFLFTVQPVDQLVWGNPIFVQATNAGGIAWMGWNQSTIVLNSASSFCNVTYGVPYNLTVTAVADWTLGEIIGVNAVAPGTAVQVRVEVYDNRSLMATGYYGNLRIDTNDTNAAVLVWGGADPNNIALDGVGGGFTDGFYDNTVQLWTPRPFGWGVWVNDTTGGDNSLVDASAAFLLPYAAVSVTDNTHIRIVSGGIMWTLSVGWNLVSLTKGYTLSAFSAFEATQYIEDARVRYGLGASAIVMASLTNGQPSTISYDTYTYGPGGSDFLINNDMAYWVYVDVAIPMVYIPCNDITLPNDATVGIVANVNTVTLLAGWTMVSTGMNEASNVFGVGVNAPLLSDIDGNQGNGAAGSRFWTGGSWVAGVHYAWYDQPGGIADSNTGVDYLTGGVVLSSAAAWNPAAQTYHTCVYDAWFGLWDSGLGYNNYVDQVYYASGFWVYSAGGAITYSVIA
ncbi:MAG: hypothetical protein V1934_06465 [Methanobacteriota archaeon]